MEAAECEDAWPHAIMVQGKGEEAWNALKFPDYGEVARKVGAHQHAEPKERLLFTSMLQRFGELQTPQDQNHPHLKKIMPTEQPPAKIS